MSTRELQNYSGGHWTPITGTSSTDVVDPATGAILATHPYSAAGDVDAAVAAASAAFPQWRSTPVPSRSAILFRYRHLLEESTAELAVIVTEENGKTLAESRGELLRAIQYVEHAAAAPESMKGAVTENIGSGVDIEYVREPLGVFAVVAPFNFPAMIPLYFAWAVATGNTVVIKPSELCPLTTIRLVELAEQAGFPPGVVNVVLGDRSAVERLATHADVVGMSFVGSSEVARQVYTLVTGAAKRCQAQGGSNNHMVVTDSASIERCIPNVVSSLYGNASQRCFAGSNLLVYRDVYDEFVERLVLASSNLIVGNGKDPRVQMGPVITAKALQQLTDAVAAASAAGAELVLDGRQNVPTNARGGFWLGPTLIECAPTTRTWTEELFGPVRCIAPVDGLDEAIGVVNASTFGHTAVIYTESGGEARRFRQEAEVGQIGVNVGTPAPIAFYPVGGRKSSFYGSHRGRAEDAVDFYTDKKVVVSTWFADTSTVKAVDPSFEPGAA